jgi:hypothetical protein
MPRETNSWLMLTCRYQNQFCGPENVREVTVNMHLKQAADDFLDGETCTSHFESYHVVSTKSHPKLQNFHSTIVETNLF